MKVLVIVIKDISADRLTGRVDGVSYVRVDQAPIAIEAATWSG